MEELVGKVGLTGIVLIDIAIGILFAILTFSLISSTLHEAIAGLLNYRGEHLRKGIIRLLKDKAVSDEVLNHPLIQGLKGPKNMFERVAQILFIWGDGAKDKDRMPSSIPKHTFARVLVESFVARREALKYPPNSARNTAQRAADLVGAEIDKLALDTRLRQKLKAIVRRIDFDKVETELDSRVDAGLNKAQAIGERLGIEVDHLGLDQVVAARIKSSLTHLKLDDGTGSLSAAIGTVIDNLSVEEKIKEEVLSALFAIDLDALEKRVDTTIRTAVSRAEEALQNAVQEVEAQLADWFDASMDRVTGWYVRRTKTMLFIIGFLMAAGLNFDVIGYGKQLATDDALRSAIVARANAAASSGQLGAFELDSQRTSTLAAQAVGNPDPTEEEQAALTAMSEFDANGDRTLDTAEIEQAAEKLRAAFHVLSTETADAIATFDAEIGDQGLTIGASFWSADLGGKGRMILSFLLIGIGCTLGGQFWFDLLKTVLKVRAGASGLNSDIENIARQFRSRSQQGTGT